MQPIEEYGKGRGMPYGKPDPTTGQVYYGRGFVQLTWERNYKTMTDLLGVDFVNHPDLALELDNATNIMFIGMIKGLFTGKSLGDYFNRPPRTGRTRARSLTGWTRRRRSRCTGIIFMPR